jgi:hypothetical protein
MRASHRAVLAAICLVLLCGIPACIDKSSSEQLEPDPTPTPTPTPTPVETEIAAALRTLSAKAIYFGHQSVGYNIMDGVQAIISGVTSVTPSIRETADPASMQAGIFAHAANGSNGDPIGKTTAFSNTVLGGVGSRVNIAFFKFCYVDFDGSTNVNAVFVDYQAKMAALEAAFPNVRFVHVTVPLETGANSNNAVRERFSNLIRQTYSAGEPVFDLARVESTKSDGSTESYSGVRALVGAYSSDGGHLNGTGQEVVAKALVLYLATL